MERKSRCQQNGVLHRSFCQTFCKKFVGLGKAQKKKVDENFKKREGKFGWRGKVDVSKTEFCTRVFVKLFAKSLWVWAKPKKRKKLVGLGEAQKEEKEKLSEELEEYSED